MNVVSSNYKDLINTSLSLSPKFKIIIDNKEYLSNVIKSYPKISHANTKFIGGFPVKTLDMEIYDLENNLDLENKEIEVYKGFVINGSIEYVKQGVFIVKAENITTNISTKSISLSNVQDRTQLLDDRYESELVWNEEQTHTGLEIVEEICTKKGITLASNTFNFANYSFKQPNFSETTTNREVLSRLAEIGGGIALFNGNGELVIKTQFITGDTFQTNRYEKLSREKEYKVNTLVLGKDGIDDDIVYPETIESERVEFKILDNPFVDLYREEMIEEIANHIVGMSYIPYELNNVMDGYIYELNDVIEVVDKNGETFKAVVLNISNNSRLKSIIKSEVMTGTTTNYNLAGSKKTELNNVKLEVDHVKNEINSVVEKVDEYDESISSIKQSSEDINVMFEKITKNINPETGEVESVKTSNGITLDENGLNLYKDDNSFNTQIDNEGTYYRDGDTITSQTTKDGTITKDMVLYGKYYYGVNEDLDVANFKKDDAMFVAELYTDNNGEEGFGHFYNGGDM